jgi:hypothetical protein
VELAETWDIALLFLIDAVLPPGMNGIAVAA